MKANNDLISAFLSIKKKGCAKMIDIFTQPFNYRHLLLKQRLFLYIL